MAYCPNCKKTFSDEEKLCPDCHIELLDDSAMIPMVVLTRMEDTSLSLRFMEFLKENQVHDYTMSESPDQEAMEILVPENQLDRSKKLLNSFLLENTGDIHAFSEDSIPSSGLSKKSMSEQYEDAKSAAVTFLSVGILGLGFAILSLLGILSLPLSTLSLWLLLVICIASIVYGAVSASKIKVLEPLAQSENDLMEQCRSWCAEHLHADEIDHSIPGIFSEETEARYFKRIDHMKAMIHHKFPDLRTELLDEFCDELYENIFSEE